MSRIIHLDLACKRPNYAWGPNNWKIRYTLNYKGIPHTTEWVEFVDIEAKCKEMGIPPSGHNEDGTPRYTVPAIWDPSTKTGVSDSLRIAEYLDKTYPNTPPVLFEGIEKYQHIMNAIAMPEINGIARFVIPAVYEMLNPASQDYFRRTREIRFGRKIEEIAPTGLEKEELWNKIRKGFGIVDGWLQQNGGPFARGEQISFVDFALAGYIMWIKFVVGEDSWMWKDLQSWNDGRWGRYLQSLEKYETFVEREN
ncbi:hypothetical protein AX17_005396 [Amanita inopinata Kibby_2008]|nr:hypothetical protein AX17_005396 [Amanita inopinata Kibby_2008]